MSMKERVRFFADNAGYASPPGRMRCAKALAEAEVMAWELGWKYEWEWDEAGCSGCDCGSKRCACSTGEEHETLCCILRGDGGEVLASLGGICGATRSYQRVVEAELAQEARGAALVYAI